jgi:hypothetical protein
LAGCSTLADHQAAEGRRTGRLGRPLSDCPGQARGRAAADLARRMAAGSRRARRQPGALGGRSTGLQPRGAPPSRLAPSSRGRGAFTRAGRRGQLHGVPTGVPTRTAFGTLAALLACRLQGIPIAVGACRLERGISVSVCDSGEGFQPEPPALPPPRPRLWIVSSRSAQASAPARRGARPAPFRSARSGPSRRSRCARRRRPRRPR